MIECLRRIQWLSPLDDVVVVITGTRFSTTLSENSVSFGSEAHFCAVSRASATEIECTMPSTLLHAGFWTPAVTVRGLGSADLPSGITLSVAIDLSSLSQIQGSTHGGHELVLTGSGFSTTPSIPNHVNICGVSCAVQSSLSSSTSITCITPASASFADRTCDVKVFINVKGVDGVSDVEVAKTLSSSYSYATAATPTITSVTPKSGSTAGGTSLTISGSSLGSIKEDIVVMLDGAAACIAKSASDVQVVCRTGAHQTTSATEVTLRVKSKGKAAPTNAVNVLFTYQDVWSSVYTWGGSPPPVAGDSVVIPAGKTVILDTDTPVLGLIVVEGTLKFDESKDLELQATWIIINVNGIVHVLCLSAASLSPHHAQTTGGALSGRNRGVPFLEERYHHSTRPC